MTSVQIIESLECWASSFSDDSTNNICALYDEQASLWGTFSLLRRDNAALIKDYFEGIFKYQNRNVNFTDSSIRFFGDVAICNGSYTFSWVNNGIEVITMARFSLVYVKKDGRWFIIEHHSSAMPST